MHQPYFTCLYLPWLSRPMSRLRFLQTVPARPVPWQDFELVPLSLCPEKLHCPVQLETIIGTLKKNFNPLCVAWMMQSVSFCKTCQHPCKLESFWRMMASRPLSLHSLTINSRVDNTYSKILSIIMEFEARIWCCCFYKVRSKWLAFISFQPFPLVKIPSDMSWILFSTDIFYELLYIHNGHPFKITQL